MTRIRWILTWALEILKISTLTGSFGAKYIKFDLKKYRGVTFCDTEEWYRIWRKTDLWFGKRHEKYGKFSPENAKVSKFWLWWDLFIQSRKFMSLKFPEELCVMTMKNDAKFEKQLTCCFKLTWGIWRILTQTPQCLKNLHFNELFLNKVYNVWAKKV